MTGRKDNAMEFKLHTFDIQYLIIALLDYKADDIITDVDKKRLDELLSKLNNLCKKENNYTITLTAN